MKDNSRQAPEVKNPGNILTAASLADLKSLEAKKVYPAGHEFFVRGQSPAGVYILYAGRVRLCISNTGHQFTIGYAQPGDILGLSAVVLDRGYEETAEAALPCRVGYIPCQDFRHFLERHPEAAFWVVQLLSERVTVAFDQLLSFRDLPLHGAIQ